jgi:hypothetical protein
MEGHIVNVSREFCGGGAFRTWDIRFKRGAERLSWSLATGNLRSANKARAAATKLQAQNVKYFGQQFTYANCLRRMPGSLVVAKLPALWYTALSISHRIDKETFA